MIAAIVRSRLRMAGRLWAGGGRARHPAIALVISALMALMIHAGLRQAFAAIGGYGAEAGARAGLLVLLMWGSFAALIGFDVEDVVRSLLLDPDLDLLRRAPITPQRILLIKGLDTSPRTVMPLLVLALPGVAAYLEGAPRPLEGALVAAAALLLLWFAALALGVAISLPLLRVAPAARTREALATLSALLLSLLWIAGAMALPRALGSDSAAAGDWVHRLDLAAASAGPAAAAARAIAGAASAPPGGALIEIAHLAAFAIAMAILASLVVGAALDPVLERVSTVRAEDPSRRPAGRGAAHRWRDEGAVRAVLRRDGRMFRRDWPLMSDVLLSAGLWGLLPLLGLASPQFGGAELARWILLSLAIGLGYEVAARTIPFERHAGYWMRVSPIAPRDYLIGKLAGSGLISAPMLAAVALAFIVSGFARPAEVAVTLWIAAGALILSQAVGLWSGATFGDPKWVNPRAMLRFGGRMIAAALVLGQLIGWVLLSFFMDRLGGRSAPIAILVLPPALGIGIGMVFLRAAGRRLEGMDSSN